MSHGYDRLSITIMEGLWNLYHFSGQGLQYIAAGSASGMSSGCGVTIGLNIIRESRRSHRSSVKSLQSLVEQVSRLYIGKCSQEAPLDVRNGLLEFGQKLLHLFALHVGRAADRAAAADDWKFVLPGKLDDLLLLDIYQRSDNSRFAVVGEHGRGHGLEGADKELVQEQGLDKVVQVVSEGELVAAELLCEGVERAALQPGTDGAEG